MAADVTVAPTLGHAVLMTQGGVGATPGYDAIDLRRMAQAASGAQEGVYDATGWKVRERAAGANMTVEVDANVGVAQVKGESVTHQGPYVVAPHSAVITLDVATAHSTNPRIDMVILHVRDNAHDALGANDARVRILSGTATSGATLDNLNGQASLPANAIRLADVLVPATDTTISNAQIRDRRLWARGAFRRIVRNANASAGTDYTMSSPTNLVLIDSTNLQPRIECSGTPLRVTLMGRGGVNAAGAHHIKFTTFIDGANHDGMTVSEGPHRAYVGAVAAETIIALSDMFVPSAGSHLIGPAAVADLAGSIIRAQTTVPLIFTVEELVRQNADNT